MTRAPQRSTDQLDRATADSHPYLVLAIVLTATFMQLVDVSIVNVAIPSIQRNLHASYGAVQLVLVFYQLAFACALITAARLGDIHGRKRLFLIGMTGFTIASAVCGAAPNATVLVTARFVQGLMSGLMYPQVLSVIQVTFPPRERGRAFGIFGATMGLATILGPLLGGALIKWDVLQLDWRAIFYVNLPVGAVALTAAVLRLRESRAPDAPRLDVPGALLVTAGLFLLVYPLTQGRDEGWPVWILAMLVGSLPVLTLFVWYELRRSRGGHSPLVVMSLFANRGFRVGLLLTLLFLAGIPAFFFSFSVYLQIGQGFSALGAGLTSFYFALGTGLASVRSDAVARRLGNGVLLVGCAVTLAGMGLILLTVHLVGVHPHTYSFIPAFLVAGVGLGLVIAPLANVVLANVTQQQAGPASGLLSTVQQVGGALGVALIGVILFGLLGTNAVAAADATLPGLRAQLSSAGLPAPAVRETARGYLTCFSDRAHAADPTAVPASCARLNRLAAAAPAPAATRRAVGGAVQSAAGQALARDFSRSFQEALGYELLVIALSLGCVLALPRGRTGAVPRPGVAGPA